MSGELQPGARPGRWLPAAAVFFAVLAAQLWLVARAGTDIPFQDQWDLEGSQLYPQWRDGTLRFADIFRAHNEHRIVWTKALDLALFAANGGQWDPLVQLVAGAALRAAAAAVLAWGLATSAGVAGRWCVGAGVALAFLPQLAWHNALWGFQSQVYFSLLFSTLALAWLGAREPTRGTQFAGLAAGLAALLAMSAGAFVPVALLGLAGLRALERRRWQRADWRAVWPAAILLGAALALRVKVPEHAAQWSRSAVDFFGALGQVLAWPHVGQPFAGAVLNAPLLIAVAGRVTRGRRAAAGEDFVLLLGGWSLAGAAAVALARGGGGEFAGGVPSRYVDFFVVLPLANAWCVAALAVEVVDARRALARWCAAAWAGFLLVGWLGLSAQTMRGIILPRVRDREAPVRLAVAFQASGDAAVFAGQPRLLVPHPNPESVRRVLIDPRMRGALPPSLQPDRPMGPLSRAVRWWLW